MSLSPDGVVFGLPFEDYLAEERFSGHGTLKLRQSTLDFWVSSWMNKNLEEEDSEFKRKGTAYHKRIVEGKRAFAEAYCTAPRKDDYEDLMETVDDMREFLTEMGVECPSKWKKADYIRETKSLWPDAPIWEEIIEQSRIDAGDKEIISAKWVADIELAAANIENHPELKNVFVNGMPEVSVFWTESVEVDGKVYQVPMKSRFDYLKTKLIPDLKSFSNVKELPLDLALYSVMASRKYHISAAIYYTASDHLAEHISAGRVVVRSGAKPAAAWLDAVVQATPERQFFFVFQKSGPAPVALGRYLRRQTGAIDTGLISYKDALEQFVRARETYGTDPWVVVDRVKDFEDHEFPAYTW